MTPLQAGVARANITPAVGIPMTGFAGRGPAEGTHDPLYATALALECGGRKAVIVTLDLLWVEKAFVAPVRKHIEETLGVPGRDVMFCASHTHYGPDTATEDSPPIIASYLENLKFLIAGAVQEALSKLQPVQIGYGTGASYIGINRREKKPDGRIVLGNNPSGPCDREVRLVRLDTLDGKPQAVLVNFACHPVSPAHGMRQLSADFVGVMRGLVEANTGATCLYLQGAAANINPVEMRHSFEPARRLGQMLGGEVLRIFGAIDRKFEGLMEEADHGVKKKDSAPGTAAAATGLATASKVALLPFKTFPSHDVADQEVAALEAALAKATAEAHGKVTGHVWWAKRKLSIARQMQESLRTGKPVPPVPAEICAVRFGDIAIATAPGEIFTETGMDIKKRSPIAKTLFTGYSNDTIWYVPIPSAYPEGGYEVVSGCKVDPPSAGIVADTALEMLKQVAES